MFDRFTIRAKKVMSLSRQEAQNFNHNYIGTEHILLGLLVENSGVAAHILKKYNIAEIRRLTECRMVKEASHPLGQLPFTPRAKKALELALDAAQEFGHNYIGTEHLLVGLLRENEGIAANALLNSGIKLEDIQREIIEILGCYKEPTTQSPISESSTYAQPKVKLERILKMSNVTEVKNGWEVEGRTISNKELYLINNHIADQKQQLRNRKAFYSAVETCDLAARLYCLLGAMDESKDENIKSIIAAYKKEMAIVSQKEQE